MNKVAFLNTPFGASLRLMRPPNLVTAISDVWAGAAVAGFVFGGKSTFFGLTLMSLSSVCLYAGGVVMNDVFDAELDAVERPERPIPSGIMRKSSAAILGIVFLILGIVGAAFVGKLSAIVALLIAIFVNIYDYRAKHHGFWGPLVMGICRGLNFFLGMSLVIIVPGYFYWLPLVPVVYIAAVTLISRGEVHGGNRKNILLAMGMYGSVILTILIYGIMRKHWETAILFLLLFAFFIFGPLIKALKNPVASKLGLSVKAGVLGLILMNAAWVAVGSGWIWACLTALLLPVSILLARYFAVT